MNSSDRVEGSLSADITVANEKSQFSAEEMDVYEIFDRVHVWGMTGDANAEHRLVLLSLPKTLKNGKHPISAEGSQGVQAALASDLGSGFAESGNVEIEWGPAQSTLEASFDFSSEKEAAKFKVSSGEMNIKWRSTASTQAIKGAGSANISPPVFGEDKPFSPKKFSFLEYTSEYRLGAFEEKGDRTQGVYLFFPRDSKPGEKREVTRALFVVDGFIYLTHDLKTISLKVSEEHVRVEYAFSFNYKNVTHHVSDGFVEIKPRP